MNRLMNAVAAGLATSLGLSGCASADPAETYTGYYRQGFEQQDFYTLSGDGPWMLLIDEATSEVLMEHHVDRQGRGSHLTVALSFEAEESPLPDFANADRYRGALTLTELHDARKFDEQEWWGFVGALSAEP